MGRRKDEGVFMWGKEHAPRAWFIEYHTTVVGFLAVVPRFMRLGLGRRRHNSLVGETAKLLLFEEL